MGSPFNSDGVRPGEADYRSLEGDLLDDRVSRHVWMRTAVNVLVLCFPIAVLLEIKKGGFDKFLAIAREQWADHAFQYEDYQFAWEVVERAIEDRLRKADVKGTH